jgi:hypothetical protein
MSDIGNDQDLLAELAEAMRAARAVPDRIIAAGRSAFAWRNIDAELVALTQDAAGAARSGTRAEPASVRALTFVASNLTIEVEVTPDALHGQVVPPQPGEIELRDRTGTIHTAPVDEVGWFVLGPPPRAMFRLHLRTAAGVAVVTEWVTL